MENVIICLKLEVMWSVQQLEDETSSSRVSVVFLPNSQEKLYIHLSNIHLSNIHLSIIHLSYIQLSNIHNTTQMVDVM